MPPLQAVPSLALAVEHFPPLQRASLHSGAGQDTQAPPPLPQALVAVPATHFPAEMHPGQPPHAPCWQVESALAQLAQAAPPVPQSVSLVPGWQVEPSQQPVQQLFARQVPLGQVAPSGASASPQVPAEQVGTLQTLLVEQVEQLAPPIPQAAGCLPD